MSERKNKKGFKHIKNKEQFIERANKVHNFKYDYSKVEFAQREMLLTFQGNKARKPPEYYRDAKITIVCPRHGEFVQTARKHIEKNGSGCPTCGVEKITKALYGKNKNADFTTANSFVIEDAVVVLKSTPSDGVERTVLFDEEDKSIVSLGKWYVTGHQASRTNRTEYCITRRNNRIGNEEYEWLGSSPKLHRLIMSRMLGRPLEKGEYVDHVDGNGLNNRRSNLRLATQAMNSRNTAKVRTFRGRPPSSQYKGVCFVPKTNKDGTDGSRYWSYIGGCSKDSATKRRYLGYFKPTPEGELAAAEAYDRAFVELWEVVNPERQLNFPDRLEEYLATKREVAEDNK